MEIIETIQMMYHAYINSSDKSGSTVFLLILIVPYVLNILYAIYYLYKRLFK